jgi:hypothetical protein
MRLNSSMTISLHQWRTPCTTGNPLLLRDPNLIQMQLQNEPLLDDLGHHISTAYGQGGFRIMTHDSLKFCIKDLLNSCGIKSIKLVEVVEVAECFIVAGAQI